VSLRRRFALVTVTALVAVISTGIILIASFHRLVSDGRATAAGLAPDSQGAKQLQDLASLASWYAVLLVGTTSLLLLLVAVLTYGLRRDVLRPLQRLRADLGQVTDGNVQFPIGAAGPVEIAIVGADAEAMRRSLVTQLDLARAAQAGLAQDRPLVAAINDELATPTDAAASGYSLSGLRHAAEGVISGDWWDAVAVPGGRLGIVLADATGHGPAAGVSALRVKTATRLLLADGAAPRTIVSQLDRVFQDIDGRFVTLIVVVLDPVAGQLTWANAGHDVALLRRADGTYVDLEPTGPLLSRLSGNWEEHTVRFSGNDVLVVYSDGLAESLDEDSQPLTVAGIRNLLDAAIEVRGFDAELLAPQLEAAARARAAAWASDDLTLVVVSASG